MVLSVKGEVNGKYERGINTAIVQQLYESAATEITTVGAIQGDRGHPTEGFRSQILTAPTMQVARIVFTAKNEQ